MPADEVYRDEFFPEEGGEDVYCPDLYFGGVIEEGDISTINSHIGLLQHYIFLRSDDGIFPTITRDDFMQAVLELNDERRLQYLEALEQSTTECDEVQQAH